MFSSKRRNHLVFNTNILKQSVLDVPYGKITQKCSDISSIKKITKLSLNR